MKIVLDVYGGDNGAEIFALAGERAIDKFDDLQIVLVGDQAELEGYVAKCRHSDRFVIIGSSEIITNCESPTMAVKTKKDSSLVKGLEYLNAETDKCAFISAGSTGAVLTGAFMKLGRIKGISRPALAPILPTDSNKNVILCDCGANVDCKPAQLYQFGIMASEFAKIMLNVQNPVVGILSNGAEAKKGNELTKEASELLQDDKNLNFVGNCEARDIMTGKFDVVVSDGFNGNIALKSAEGTAKAIMKILKDSISESGISSKIGALLLKKNLKQLKQKMDYNNQGGGCFLGVNKVVLKAHGSSGEESILKCIEQAYELADKDISGKIKAIIEADRTDSEKA